MKKLITITNPHKLLALMNAMRGGITVGPIIDEHDSYRMTFMSNNNRETIDYELRIYRSIGMDVDTGRPCIWLRLLTKPHMQPQFVREWKLGLSLLNDPFELVMDLIMMDKSYDSIPKFKVKTEYDNARIARKVALKTLKRL
jgi:hypothetical protein